MFRYMGEHTEELQQSSELLEDTVVSLISKIGINIPMSDTNHDDDKSLNKAIFELTQRKVNHSKKS